MFVSESGPKNARVKRLTIMDYDGANVQYLTDGSAIVLAPRFSPNGDRVLYTSVWFDSADELPTLTVILLDEL